MKSLCAEENYDAAAEIADTINWNKVKNVNALVSAGEIYEKTGRYEDSKELLLMAYDRSPIGRTIIYRLAEVAVKMKDYELAREYYEEFVEIAPHDNLKYVLEYTIKKAQGASYDELIPILEELKEQEYSEEWAYELAYLYHKAGMSEKCIGACDELILWFGDGPYVERALELKMLYQPLTRQQEEKYREIRQERTGVTQIGAEEMKKAGEYEHEAVEIPQVNINPERFNTVNLQEEIAKGLNLKNGYIFNSVTQNIPYIKLSYTITNEVITLNDINSMRTSAGLYIFTIKDSAGNVSYKTMIVDNSSPLVLSFTDEDKNSDGDRIYFVANDSKKIASRNTIVFWGDNKVIQINTALSTYIGGLNADIKKIITQNYTFDDSNLLVALKNATSVEKNIIADKSYTQTAEISNSSQVFYIKYTDAQLTELNSSKQKQEVINKYWNYSDHIHSITVNDNSNQFAQTNNNKVYSTSALFGLEMNSDNSLLMAYVCGDYPTNDSQRLYQAEIATGDKLYLEWIENEGNDFEVKSIKYYYYPLDFDTTSANYPYSSTPQLEKELDLTLRRQPKTYRL